uniref:Phosphatidate cytidylyltransferase, mitochondrial n=1 Tax=Kalanchoe fedtschenkoi TaxID=63787 RepID=A0A7N0VAR2_KALFE
MSYVVSREFSMCFDVAFKVRMHSENKDDLGSLLDCLPPVDFCCIYGSTLHPNNHDKSEMVDYILGVSDPLQWHNENLKMNKDHYASWMAHLGGAKLVTHVADKVGVGVHFHPFVTYNGRLFKYGVVRMNDLVEDILQWKKFYLSGRLQKPVRVVVDNLDINNLNYVNLRAAVSAALLLLPAKFTEADLYAKICSLSYMGDVRMLFAEDRNKVKTIVTGQFDLFTSMYKQTLEGYAAKDVLKLSSLKHQELEGILINSREGATRSMTKVLRRTVMVSSARQAVSGLLSVGGVNAARYLSSKMRKAWKSWT